MILIPLDRITDNPWQTRQRYDAHYIESELAPSLARSGLLQTPTARLVNGAGAPVPVDGIDLGSEEAIRKLLRAKPAWRVQLAFAHNRRRAFDFLASQSTPVPGVTRPGHMPLRLALLSDEDMAEHAFVENDKRKDLTPVEEALAYQRRIEDFGYSHQALAERYGKKRATVSNKLRLLKLPREVLDAVSDRRLSERAALSLVPLYVLPEPLARGVRTYRATDWVGIRPNNEWKEHVVFDQLVVEACAGVLRSDAIRQRVERLLLSATEPLALVDPEHDYGAEGVAAMRQGACTPEGAARCPLLVEAQERRGGEKTTTLRCGDPMCHQEKAAHAAGIILKAAHEETGLPITAIDDENRTTTFDRHGSGKKLGARLVRKGCPKERLHIRLAGRYPGYCLTGKGHPNAELVCVHSAGGHCACQGKPDQNGRQSAAAAAAAQETRIGRAQARRLGEERYAAPAKQATFEALQARDPLVWNVAMGIVRTGTGSSWEYGGSNRNGFFCDDHFQEDGTPEHSPTSFEDLCRMLAEWTLDIEAHHWQYPDSLEKVEQFARRRMEAMGLSYKETVYGAVDIEAVAELATLPAGDAGFHTALMGAGAETLRDVARRITDEAGKPTRGHKARLERIEVRLAEMEPVPVPA